jgi:iron complex transport system substrate-binding protein
LLHQPAPPRIPAAGLYHRPHRPRAAILQKQDASTRRCARLFADLKAEEAVGMLVVDEIKDSFRVIANSSQDYSLSGTRNLAADDTGEWWRTVDAEQLLVWNPAIIVIPAYASELKPADFYGNAVLANLDAVKNKRVYKFPHFNRSPDAAEIYLSDEWLARVANPAHFSSAGKFHDTLKESYKLIYQKDITDGQIRFILELEQNKDSAGYVDLFG